MNEKGDNLIRSMTGYGRAEGIYNERTITVELRSVNNRYLDASVKMPMTYIFAEEKIKKHVQQSISRGKVDIFVSIEAKSKEKVAVKVNETVADAYYQALTSLRDSYHLSDDISVSLLSRFSDVFIVEKEQEDLEVVGDDMIKVLSVALESLNDMRTCEGEKLADDILQRGENISRLLKIVEEKGPETVNAYRAKLEKRMADVLSNTQIEESRILTEAAIFSDKVAVDEEIIRLRSHLTQMKDMLQTGGIVGRKLDFLIQEFNREANTIGSKCSDVEVTRIVLEIKGEIEKIREQVQNIE